MIEKRIYQLRTSWEYAKPKSTLRLADPVSPRYSGGVYESIQCNAQAYRKRLVRTYPRWNFEPSVQFINRKNLRGALIARPEAFFRKANRNIAPLEAAQPLPYRPRSGS